MTGATKQYNGKGVSIRDKRERLLSRCHGDISQGQFRYGSSDNRGGPKKFEQNRGVNNQSGNLNAASYTDKIMKNMRKQNSGIPANILIGRGGPIVVIQGNHYIKGRGVEENRPQNRKFIKSRTIWTMISISKTGEFWTTSNRISIKTWYNQIKHTIHRKNPISWAKIAGSHWLNSTTIIDKACMISVVMLDPAT